MEENVKGSSKESDALTSSVNDSVKPGILIKKSFCYQWKTEDEFKRKVQLTLAACYSYVMLVSM